MEDLKRNSWSTTKEEKRKGPRNSKEMIEHF